MPGWASTLLWCLLAAVIGGVIGFFVSRFIFKRQLEKNPPINEKMLRTMYRQMGHKPSEAQIRQVMNQINKQK